MEEKKMINTDTINDTESADISEKPYFIYGNSVLDQYTQNRYFQFCNSGIMKGILNTHGDVNHASRTYLEMSRMMRDLPYAVGRCISNEFDALYSKDPFFISEFKEAFKSTENATIDKLKEAIDTTGAVQLNCKLKEIRGNVFDMVKPAINAFAESDPAFSIYEDSEISKEAKSYLDTCNTFIATASIINDKIIKAVFGLGCVYNNCAAAIRSHIGEFVDRFSTTVNSRPRYSVEQIANMAIDTISAVDANWKKVPEVYDSFYGKAEEAKLINLVRRAVALYGEIINGSPVELKCDPKLNKMILMWLRLLCNLPDHISASLFVASRSYKEAEVISCDDLKTICNMVLDRSDPKMSSLTINLTSAFMKSLFYGVFMNPPFGFENMNDPAPITGFKSIKSVEGKEIASIYLSKYGEAKEFSTSMTEFSMHLFDRLLFDDLIMINLAGNPGSDKLRDGMNSPFANIKKIPEDVAAPVYQILKNACDACKAEIDNESEASEKKLKLNELHKEYRKAFKNGLVKKQKAAKKMLGDI